MNPGDDVTFDALSEALRQLAKAAALVGSPGASITLPKIDDSVQSDKDRSRLVADVLAQFAEIDPENKAISKEQLEGCVDWFGDLYLDDEGSCVRRHAYSVVAQKIFEYLPNPGTSSDDDTEAVSKILMMENTLGSVVSHLRSNHEDDARQPELIRCLEKLIDHIGLERERMGYIFRQNEAIANAAEGFGERIESAKSDFDQRIGAAVEGVDAMQRNSVAILGIFAAVVMTFNGAMGFGVSAFKDAAAGNFWNFVFMVSVVGLVLVNTVAVLLSFIQMLLRPKGDPPTRPRGRRKALSVEGTKGAAPRNPHWIVLGITDAVLVLSMVILVASGKVG